MRTLLRPGRRGSLVKLEGRGGTRLFSGPERNARRVFFDLEEAVRSFELVELGTEQEVDSPPLPWIAKWVGRTHPSLHRGG